MSWTWLTSSTIAATWIRVAFRSWVTPSSWVFVRAIWPWSLACELLRLAISCFWAAIWFSSFFCWAWTSDSSSPWTGDGTTAGAVTTPSTNGISSRARRKRRRRSRPDRG